MKKIILIILFCMFIIKPIFAGNQNTANYLYDLTTKLTDVDLKINYLERAIQLSPDLLPAYKSLIELYSQKNNLEKVNYYKKQYEKYNVSKKPSKQLENQIDIVGNSKEQRSKPIIPVETPKPKKKKSYLKAIVIGAVVVGAAVGSYFIWKYYFQEKKTNSQTNIKPKTKINKSLKKANDKKIVSPPIEKTQPVKILTAVDRLNKTTKQELIKNGISDFSSDVVIKWIKTNGKLKSMNELDNVPLLSEEEIVKIKNIFKRK